MSRRSQPPPSWPMPSWGQQYPWPYTTNQLPKMPKRAKEEDKPKTATKPVEKVEPPKPKKKELLILICSKERMNSLKFEDEALLKKAYPNLKIRLRQIADGVNIKTGATMEMLCPKLENLKKMPQMIGLLLDEKNLVYDVAKKATNIYNSKKKTYDKKVRDDAAMVDQLVAPDFNAEKDKVQRDSEWENFGYIRDFIHNSSQRPELKAIKFGLIIDRTKSTNLVGPLTRAGIDDKVSKKINFVHLSGGEMEKYANDKNFSEICYYCKRLAAILTSSKAKYLDGSKGRLRSESDSDTDKE